MGCSYDCAPLCEFSAQPASRVGSNVAGVTPRLPRLAAAVCVTPRAFPLP